MNKADLLPGFAAPGYFAVSAQDWGGNCRADPAVGCRLPRTGLARTEGPAITQTRHRQIVETCAGSLQDFLAGDPGLIELRAEDLRRAAHALGRVTGRVDVEDVLDQVFKRFCIGK